MTTWSYLTISPSPHLLLYLSTVCQVSLITPHMELSPWQVPVSFIWMQHSYSDPLEDSELSPPCSHARSPDYRVLYVNIVVDGMRTECRQVTSASGGNVMVINAGINPVPLRSYSASITFLGQTSTFSLSWSCKCLMTSSWHIWHFSVGTFNYTAVYINSTSISLTFTENYSIGSGACNLYIFGGSGQSIGSGTTCSSISSTQVIIWLL